MEGGELIWMKSKYGGFWLHLLLMVQKSCVHQLREVGSLSHYLQGFYTSKRWLGMGFLNQQQMLKLGEGVGNRISESSAVSFISGRVSGSSCFSFWGYFCTWIWLKRCSSIPKKSSFLTCLKNASSKSHNLGYLKWPKRWILLDEMINCHITVFFVSQSSLS